MLTVKLESSSAGEVKLLFDILEELPSTQPYSLALARDTSGIIAGTVSFDSPAPAAAPVIPVESPDAAAAAIV